MVRTDFDSSNALSLRSAFRAFAKGERPVGTRHEAKILFEAVQLQPSPAESLEQIIASPHFLTAIHHSTRVCEDEAFVCEQELPFLAPLSDA